MIWIANERPAIFEEVVKKLLEGPTLLRRIGLHATPKIHPAQLAATARSSLR